MASPAFEGGRPGEAAVEVTRLLERAFRNAGAVDLEALCVVAGVKACHWWQTSHAQHVTVHGAFATLCMIRLLIHQVGAHLRTLFWRAICETVHAGAVCRARMTRHCCAWRTGMAPAAGCACPGPRRQPAGRMHAERAGRADGLPPARHGGGGCGWGGRQLHRHDAVARRAGAPAAQPAPAAPRGHIRHV